MKSKLKSAVFAALLGVSLSANAQIDSFKGFSKEDLIADYRLAMDILKKQHPDPYRFMDSASYDRQVDSLLKKMSDQKDIGACNQFSPIGLIRDVHTNLAYSDENNREIFNSVRFLPFPVIIERGKMWVNIKGESIPFGAEIVSINNKPVNDIIAALSSGAYSDGYITTGIDRVYSEFQVKFSLPDADRKTYDVAYKTPGSNTVKKASLPSADPTQAFHSKNKAVFPLNLLQRAYYVYRGYDEATQTGILTVNSFNLQEVYAYKEFSEFFKEVNKRQYKHVIIDIRSNGGGNPAISALLYSFISPAAFRNEYNYRTRHIDIAYPEYAITNGRKYSEEDISNTRNFLYQRFDKDSTTGLYIGNARMKEGQLESFPRDKDAFSGDVYVLTGGGTVSAATYFASLVQKNKRGKLIGKETGSGEQATVAGWFITYQLPKTKSVLTVPMTELYFFNASEDKGRGVIPDMEVPLEKFESYILASEDPELTYTLDFIKSLKPSPGK